MKPALRSTAAADAAVATPANARQVKALLTQGTANADRLKRSIATLVATLAARMQELHGHNYRAQIDHSADIECIFIVPGPEAKKAKPQRGELA